MKSSKCKFAAVVVAVFISALAVSGCGGSSKIVEPPVDAPPSMSQQRPDAETIEKFTDCLKKQGVDLPDNPGQGQSQGGPPDGFDPSSMDRKAMQACAKYMPQGGPPGGGPPPGAPVQ